MSRSIVGMHLSIPRTQPKLLQEVATTRILSIPIADCDKNEDSFELLIQNRSQYT